MSWLLPSRRTRIMFITAGSVALAAFSGAAILRRYRRQCERIMGERLPLKRVYAWKLIPFSMITRLWRDGTALSEWQARRDRLNALYHRYSHCDGERQWKLQTQPAFRVQRSCVRAAFGAVGIFLGEKELDCLAQCGNLPALFLEFLRFSGCPGRSAGLVDPSMLVEPFVARVEIRLRTSVESQVETRSARQRHAAQQAWFQDATNRRLQRHRQRLRAEWDSHMRDHGNRDLPFLVENVWWLADMRAQLEQARIQSQGGEGSLNEAMEAMGDEARRRLSRNFRHKEIVSG